MIVWGEFGIGATYFVPGFGHATLLSASLVGRSASTDLRPEPMRLSDMAEGLLCLWQVDGKTILVKYDVESLPAVELGGEVVIVLPLMGDPPPSPFLADE